MIDDDDGKLKVFNEIESQIIDDERLTMQKRL